LILWINPKNQSGFIFTILIFYSMFDPDNLDQFQYKLDLFYRVIHNELELTPYWFIDRVL